MFVLVAITSASYGEALMLLLSDQPGVRTGFVGFALSRRRRERSWASVISSFKDLCGPHGDKAFWKPIKAHQERVLCVELEAALSPEDCEMALAHWRSSA